MKYSKEELAEASKEVFANIQADKLFATEDGNFFEKEPDAVRHSNSNELEIFVFSRVEIEGEPEQDFLKPSLVSQDEITHWIDTVFENISKHTDVSKEDLKAMAKDQYVKPEAETEANKEDVKDVETPKEESKTEGNKEEKAQETTVVHPKKGTKK